jgi:hypothetical protein
MQANVVNLAIVIASVKHPSGASATAPLLPEPAFYRELCSAGKELGVNVYVLSAECLHPQSKLLYGYRWVDSRWEKQSVPYPDLIYDRCFFANASERLECRRMLGQLAAIQPFRRLNGALPAKLDVYEWLKKDPLLSRHLPLTLPLQTEEQLYELIHQYPSGIILKPSAGMQGRGIIHIKLRPLDSAIQIKGRTRRNRSFSLVFEEKQECEHWVSRFIYGSLYIIQPYLELSGVDRKPFDIRALIQKDGKGIWSVSGMAARTGQAGSLTSNLHGGGGAVPAASLLSAKYGKPKAERLLEQIHTISKQTAVRLESKYGRFAELGLDYGIDQSGLVWLLEANSKPGRSSFRAIGDPLAMRHSIERPLLYAALLSRRLSPSFVANESANGRHQPTRPDNLLRPFNVQEVHR